MLKKKKRKKKVQIVSGALRYFLSKYYKVLCTYFEEKKSYYLCSFFIPNS